MTSLILILVLVGVRCHGAVTTVSNGPRLSHPSPARASYFAGRNQHRLAHSPTPIIWSAPVSVKTTPREFFPGQKPTPARIGLALLPALSSGRTLITESFLDRLEQIESRGNCNAVGDHGRARGSFQLWEAVWRDANRAITSRGGMPVPFESATDRAASRLIARVYLQSLESRLAASLRTQPTPQQLLSAWNLGFRGFQRRGFSISRCPAITQRMAAEIRK